MMRKKTILKKLAVALDKLGGEYFGTPTIMDGEGWRTPTLCWDGPYDWISFSMGQSYMCGEAGNYSMPIEPELQAVIDLASANGYYFEPENQAQMCLAD